MIKKVEKFCLEYNLLQKNNTILIACSGGADSIALVDIFRQLSAKYEFKIHVAHAEHGIRKESSLADAKYVERYCQKYDLPFHLKHLNVPSYSKMAKLSTETAARKLRYEFLRQTATKINATKIATAHHLNDQAETVLSHLMRGAGTDGLSGMKVINNDIIRPFLSVYRHEIEAYCQKYNLKPRIDETNALLDYERNKIRLKLLPQMQEYNSNVISAICRSAKIICEEHDFFKSQVEKIYNLLCIQKKDKISVDINRLKQEHSAVRKALYRLIVEKLAGNLTNISFERIDKIDKFVYNGHTGSILQLPHSVRILYDYSNLIFFQEGNFKNLAKYNILVKNATINIADIDKTKSIVLDEKNILELTKVEDIADVFSRKIKGHNSCFIDMDKISPKLFIRYRQNGDKIIPKGMAGTKKLKDIFIDRKIPANKRDTIPLICNDNGDIIWIAGVQQSAKYLVDECTKQALYLNLIKNN